MKKNYLSITLALCIALTMTPLSPFAQESHATIEPSTTQFENLCEHHEEHDDNCGYIAENEYSSCNYVCEECEQDNVTNNESRNIAVRDVHSHCVCGGDVTIGDHETHEAIAYDPFPSDFVGGDLEGNYYLDRNVALTSTMKIPNSSTLNLCLNGHELSMKDDQVIDNQGTINLYDCTGNGNISSLTENMSLAVILIYNQNTGTFNMYGGNISNNLTYQRTLINNYGTFNMYGGNISNNETPDASNITNYGDFNMYGGYISNNTSGYRNFINYKRFTIHDGSFSDNTARYGNISISFGSRSEFTMLGGNFSNNTSDSSNIDNSGKFTMRGGSISDNKNEINCILNGATFNMHGGSIKNNITSSYSLTNGGIATGNFITLGGNIDISGNKAGDKNKDIVLRAFASSPAARSSNVDIPTIYIEEPLTNTTPIGVSITQEEMSEPARSRMTTYIPGVFTSGDAVKNSDYLRKFTSDNPDLVVAIADDDQLQLTDPPENNSGGSSGGSSSSSSSSSSSTTTTAPTTDKDESTSNDNITNIVFNDVKETDWYYQSISKAVSYGLFVGTDENQFSPEMSTTRGMMAAILFQMEDKPSLEITTTTFDDVSSEGWYYDGIVWAQQNKVVKGYSVDTYRADDNITREQMIAILYHYAIYKEIDITPTTELNNFVDGSDTSNYALTSMKWAVSTGLIGGKEDNRLDPQGLATRAEVATVLVKFIELYLV